MKVTCVRCGREAEVPDLPTHVATPPEGWEGTIFEPVCPGCQFAEWHPHCTSLIDLDGERLNLAVIPREEVDWNRVTRCEYIDLTIAVVDGDDWPDTWQCPKCGGTDFEWVHADYMPSGLQPGSFEADAEEIDDS